MESFDASSSAAGSPASRWVTRWPVAAHVVLLAETEPVLAHHTTGRSAAMFLETYGTVQTRRIAIASRAGFEEPPGLDRSLLTPRGLPRRGRPGRGRRDHRGGRSQPGAGRIGPAARRGRGHVGVPRTPSDPCSGRGLGARRGGHRRGGAPPGLRLDDASPRGRGAPELTGHRARPGRTRVARRGGGRHRARRASGGCRRGVGGRAGRPRRAAPRRARTKATGPRSRRAFRRRGTRRRRGPGR